MTQSTEQERASYEDGAWYWVEKEGWHDEPPKIAPAMYRADCDAWYSWEFSGISTEYLKVLEPCLRHEQAARRAPVVPDGWLPTIENINALPEPLRKYICDLETNCDPSGMVRHNTILRDQVSGLQVMYRKAVDALASAPKPPEKCRCELCKNDGGYYYGRTGYEPCCIAPVQLPDSELREAAQAVVVRWDSPNWKDLPATGDYIARLRKALAATPLQQEAAPVQMPEPEATVHSKIGTTCMFPSSNMRKGDKIYTEHQVRQLLAKHGIK